MTRGSVFLILVAFTISAMGPSRAISANHFEHLIVFGDSLSDTGNVFQFNQGTFPPSSPPGLYAEGRFSNGPAWVEHLAEAIDVTPPTPSLQGGTNFAWGGAQSGTSFEPFDSTLDPDPFPLSTTISVRDQVNAFLGGLAGGAGVPDPEMALYVVWGGTNDFLVGTETDPSVVVGNISSVIGDLVRQASARYLLVPNMPSLADIPGVAGGFDSAFVAENRPSNLRELVNDFNSGLRDALADLRSENRRGVIYELDVFSLFQQVLQEPAAFGFNSNASIPVLHESVLYGTEPGPLFLNDPTTTLFWDGVHPTSRAHAVLAAEAARVLAIPEPCTGTLALAVLFTVGVLCRGCTPRTRGVGDSSRHLSACGLTNRLSQPLTGRYPQ